MPKRGDFFGRRLFRRWGRAAVSDSAHIVIRSEVGVVVDFAIDVPDVPALAGAVVYQQTVQLEVAAGLIASASVANGPALTLGTF